MARRRPRRPGGTLKDSERRQLAYASRRRAAAAAEGGERASAPEGDGAAGHRVLCDGGSRGNPGPAAVAAVLLAPDGTRIAERAERIGRATAGEAEYRAIAVGLELATTHGVRTLEVCSDSQIAIDAIEGGTRPDLEGAARQLGSVTWRWHPRERNDAADALVRALLW